MSVDGITIRPAEAGDVPTMVACRLMDPSAGPADRRMTAYFSGEHHPQHALPSRTGYVAMQNERVIGYVAGHLTSRFGCSGEVQYLFVAPSLRRRGVGTLLIRHLAGWFSAQNALKVCVCVDASSPDAQPFYSHLRAAPLAGRRIWYAWDDMTGALESALQ